MFAACLEAVIREDGDDNDKRAGVAVLGETLWLVRNFIVKNSSK